MRRERSGEGPDLPEERAWRQGKMDEKKPVCFVVSDGRLFAFRFCDSSFGSKWAGLWEGKRKILEYWAFRAGDEWLSPDKSAGFSLDQESQRAEISFGAARETCGFWREQGFRSRLRLSAPARIGMEICFDLRDSHENATGREYEVASFGSGTLVVRTKGEGGRSAEVRGLDGFEIRETAKRTHRPGNAADALGWKYFHEEEEDCFSVILESSADLSEAGFLVPLPPRAARQEFPRAQDLYRFSDPEVSGFFSHAVSQMRTFLQDTPAGTLGFAAGHPYFLDFWTRDACLSVPGLVRLGLFEDASRILSAIAAVQREDGCIPNIVSDAPDYASADATPLWLLALHDYCSFSGERGFLSKEALLAASFFNRTDVDKDGLSETDRGSVFEPLPHSTTWMDSIERTGRACEVQFLWGEAIRSLGRLHGSEELCAKGEGILRRAENLLWKEEWGYFLDCVGGPSENLKSSNILFALANSSVSPARAAASLAVLESDEFTRQWGITTASARNTNYGAGDGYHTGAVWNLLTALMSIAEFRAGRAEAGMKYLRILKRNFGRRCAEALDEVYDGQGNPQGAVNQAWSVCLLPRIFDDGILGMRPLAHESVVEFSPALPRDFSNVRRKDLRANGDRLEVFLERTSSGRHYLDVSGLRRNSLRFFPPRGTDKVFAGGHVVPGNRPVLVKGKGNVRIEWTLAGRPQ